MDVEGLDRVSHASRTFSPIARLFDGVRLLPAGCYLQVPLDADGPLKVHRYWDFHFQEPDGPFDEAAAIEELDFLFGQAVSRQLVSDVDVGSYLSGGMDSGSITAIASRQSPLMRTFTVGFDLSSASGVELGYDERSKAEHMSYLFKTEHYEMVLKAGDMERCLPQLAWHLEEPRVGQCYPNFYAAKLASKFDKVVLSGTGGDELFAGYPWRYYRAVVNDDFEHYISKYFAFWQRLVPGDTLPRMMAPVWQGCRQGFAARHFQRRIQGARLEAHAPGGLRQPLALFRGQDVPQRASGRRGQARDGARRWKRACHSSTTILSTSQCGCRQG